MTSWRDICRERNGAEVCDSAERCATCERKALRMRQAAPAGRLRERLDLIAFHLGGDFIPFWLLASPACKGLRRAALRHMDRTSARRWLARERGAQ